MKILVTGASGFLGKNYLLRSSVNDELIAVYNKATDFPVFLKKAGLDNVLPVKIDLTDRGETKNASVLSEYYDLCIFFSANGDPAMSVVDPYYDICSNVISLLNVMELLKVRRIIYFSSGAVYDGIQGPVSPPKSFLSPKLPYAISKLSSEHYIEYFHHKSFIDSYANVRFFGAYGPFEPERKIYSKLVRRFGLEKNPKFIIKGNGRNYIDAMFIDDAVRAVKMLEKSNLSGITDLYSGSRMSVTDLVTEAAMIFGMQADIQYEGNVPEFIEFYSEDNLMQNEFNFVPEISLQEGMKKLFLHLSEMDAGKL